MPDSPVSFGTDGWRAVIADRFTFENLERVAAATARWLLARTSGRPSVVLGYDTRFLGDRFAERTAQVMASLGIKVYLADRFVPSPGVSGATVELGCDAGVVITASHNPPIYSGFKLKTSYGGPAVPDQTDAIERELRAGGAVVDDRLPVQQLRDEGLIETVDLRDRYRAMLADQVDVDAIRASGLRLGYDPMFGAGQGVLEGVLGEDVVVSVHAEENPGFGGTPPEPIARHLDELSDLVRSENCDAGLATDGDGDRIAMVDERGRFVDPHRILALLVEYLYRERGEAGMVVKTITTTDLLDRMTDAFDLPLEVTPVGFKYIAATMREEDVLVGGEESGGIAVRGYIPERDGLLTGLRVVEMMARRDRSLSELIEDLFEEFGPHHYHRRDLHLDEPVKRRFLEYVREEGIDEVEGFEVRTVEDMDGFKFRTDGGWVMVRPSGTEPVLRIYAEAPTPERARAFVESVVGRIQEVE